MKKQFLTKFALATLALTICGFNANAQLGNLKNKVKSAANNAVSGNKDDKKDEKKNDTSTNSSNSATSDVKVDNSLTGEQLVEKADAFYEQENYKEALANYEAAKEKGDYYVSDGMVRKRMNECRDKLDPKKQEEEKKAFSQVNDIMGKLEAGKYKIEPVTDNGMTNEFHTANVGKIVFAGAEIPKTTTSASGFSNSFKLGDNIYSRVYLAKSFTNEGNSIGYISQFTDFKYRMTVAGQSFDVLPQTERKPISGASAENGPHNAAWGWPLSKVAEGESKDKWTTFQIAISPSAADASGYPLSETKDFFYRMYQLPAGTHTVKLEVVFDIPEDEVNKGSYGTDPDQGRKWTTKFGTEKVLAVGEFKVEVTEAGKIAAGKKLCPKFDWLNNKLIKVPDGFTMVSKAKREGETILKVVELHNDWTYIKNGYGIIIRRTMGGKAIAQNDKTKLCYEIDIEFSQENISSGGSKYASTMFTRNGSFENSSLLFLKECIQ